jgi:hypothetical protein
MSLNINFESSREKTLFLALLAHTLTVCARDTYEVGTETVLEPQVLRGYNELLHRVAGAVIDRLSGAESYPLEDIFKMMQAFGERNHRMSQINWAIGHAAGKTT